MCTDSQNAGVSLNTTDKAEWTIHKALMAAIGNATVLFPILFLAFSFYQRSEKVLYLNLLTKILGNLYSMKRSASSSLKIEDDLHHFHKIFHLNPFLTYCLNSQHHIKLEEVF